MIDYSKYIPERLRDTDLNKKIIEVVNNLTDEQRQEFKDVLLKYRDPFSITQDAAREIVKEFGFEYITDIMETLSNQDLGTLVTYLGFISTMKGHKTGLEVIFKLLGFSYEIVEWFEYNKDRYKGHDANAKLLEVDEWKLSINILESTSLDNIFKTIPSLKLFVRNYVYPLLAYLELLFVAELSPISATITGSEKVLDDGTTSKDTHKVATAMGINKLVEQGNSDVTFDSNTDLFDDTLLLENNYNIYTEDGNIIKLG